MMEVTCQDRVHKLKVLPRRSVYTQRHRHHVRQSHCQCLTMVTDTLTGKMSCTPILFVQVSIKKTNGAVHKNGGVDGTCKQSLRACLHIPSLYP